MIYTDELAVLELARRFASGNLSRALFIKTSDGSLLPTCPSSLEYPPPHAIAFSTPEWAQIYGGTLNAVVYEDHYKPTVQPGAQWDYHHARALVRASVALPFKHAGLAYHEAGDGHPAQWRREYDFSNTLYQGFKTVPHIDLGLPHTMQVHRHMPFSIPGHVHERVASLCDVLPHDLLMQDYSEEIAEGRSFQGLRFGSLVVESRAETEAGGLFECQCDCGTHATVPAAEIKAGRMACGECSRFPRMTSEDASRTVTAKLAAKTKIMQKEIKDGVQAGIVSLAARPSVAFSMTGALAAVGGAARLSEKAEHAVFMGADPEIMRAGIKASLPKAASSKPPTLREQQAQAERRELVRRMRFVSGPHLAAFCGVPLSNSHELHRIGHEVAGDRVPYGPLNTCWLSAEINAGLHKPKGTPRLIVEGQSYATMADACQHHHPDGANAAEKTRKALERAKTAFLAADSTQTWTREMEAAEFLSICQKAKKAPTRKTKK
jgi:hypothetical protein